MSVAISGVRFLRPLLSTRTIYGFRIMLQLALNYQSGPLHLREISKRGGLSMKYLSQIILVLRNANLVTATRGAQCGYELARAPSTITAFDVFMCLEGELLSFNEQDNAGSVVFEVWEKLKTGSSEARKGITFADLATSHKKKSSALDYSI